MWLRVTERPCTLPWTWLSEPQRFSSSLFLFPDDPSPPASSSRSAGLNGEVEPLAAAAGRPQGLARRLGKLLLFFLLKISS